MADLTGDSTVAQIESAYMANMYYARNASITEAHDFVAAATALLLKKPMQASTREGSVEFQMDAIRRQIDRAEAWIAAAANSSSAQASSQSIPSFTRVSTQNVRR